jgi:hypothetical protein
MYILRGIQHMAISFFFASLFAKVEKTPRAGGKFNN